MSCDAIVANLLENINRKVLWRIGCDSTDYRRAKMPHRNNRRTTMQHFAGHEVLIKVAVYELDDSVFRFTQSVNNLCIKSQ